MKQPVKAVLPFAVAMILSCTFPAWAETVTFEGLITQSVPDGTGPAVNNPSLNAIKDGDPYSVTLSFTGPLTSPGAFNPLSGATLAFADAKAGATETSFASVSLTITPDGSFDDVSLLGCLTTGTECDFGNELDANFQIPAVQLNSKTWSGQPLPGLLPLDLLEDDGATDIHGSIIPEPSQVWLLVAVAAGIVWWSRRRTKIS